METRLAAVGERRRCDGHERRWKELRLGLGLEEEMKNKGDKLKDLGRKGLEKEEKREEEKLLQQLMVGFSALLLLLLC